MSYKDTRRVTKNKKQSQRAVLVKSIQSSFMIMLWRFLQRRTATKAIVSSLSRLSLTKDGGRVSQRKVNLGSEQWLGDGTEVILAFKLVLLIQAIFNTEKVFTDIFGIFPYFLD